MLVDLRSGSCIHVHVYNVAHTSSHLQVRLNGSTFTVWDVGGQDKLRPLWRSYTRCTDGIIFVVDSTKEERLEEAKLELQKICKSTVTGTAAGARNKNSIPVLVLANMQVRYTLDSSYLGFRGLLCKKLRKFVAKFVAYFQRILRILETKFVGFS